MIKDAEPGDEPGSVTIPSIPSPVNEQTTFTFTATATDPGVPSTLTFDLVGVEHGTTIGSTTSTFTWVPTEQQGDGTTSYMFNVRVDDGQGGTDTMTFTVNVAEVNQDPVFLSSGPHTFNELTTLTFDVRATDGDVPANSVTYSASGLPTGAAFSGRTFTWSATEAQGPGDYQVDFRVSDGAGGVGTMTVDITTEAVNQTPHLTAISDKNIAPNNTLTFTIIGSDGDKPVNTLTYSDTGLPSGATFNATTRTFEWTPTLAQADDTYQVIFKVSDGNEVIPERLPPPSGPPQHGAGSERLDRSLHHPGEPHGLVHGYCHR